jgi:hypothetical protein
MRIEGHRGTGKVVAASVAVMLAGCTGPPYDASDDAGVGATSASIHESDRGGDDRDESRRCQPPAAVPGTLAVPAGQCLKFEAAGAGVQIYACAAGTWLLRAPEANLSDRHGEYLGNHFLGPTWQSSDGSKIKGARIAQLLAGTGADIPQLLLAAMGREGQGRLDDVTFIQRLRTKGGVAPAGPCSPEGAEARVPYSAAYLFYHPRGTSSRDRRQAEDPALPQQ